MCLSSADGVLYVFIARANFCLFLFCFVCINCNGACSLFNSKSYSHSYPIHYCNSLEVKFTLTTQHKSSFIGQTSITATALYLRLTTTTSAHSMPFHILKYSKAKKMLFKFNAEQVPSKERHQHLIQVVMSVGCDTSRLVIHTT